MEQKTKVEVDQCEHQHKYFQQSAPLQLSQIINIRLNLPRLDERKNHSEMMKQQAKSFNINKWQDMIDKDELYQMTLTGHLIKAIQLQNGSATLNNLISVTEQYLPYLRKQNGKNFTGMAARTVKGCLSAVVFKRFDEDSWSVDDAKVEEFISQANKKLAQFFEKLKKNFPPYECVKTDSIVKKTKKKPKIDRGKEEDQFLDRYQTYMEQKSDNLDINNDYKYSGRKDRNITRQNQLEENIKIENNFQGFEQNSVRINNDWLYSLSENILKNLQQIRQGEKLDDSFLGNMIAFYNLKHQLEKISECQKFID